MSDLVRLLVFSCKASFSVPLPVSPRTYMEDDKIVSPVGVQKVLQFMMAEQELLNAKRTELIKQLRFVHVTKTCPCSIQRFF